MLPRFQVMTVTHKHNLSYHSSLPEQFLRTSCLRQRESLCDDWLDFMPLQEVQQGNQILSKQSRFQPFERLDAVRDDPFPAREKPATGNVQQVDGNSMKSITTACAGRTESLHT